MELEIDNQAFNTNPLLYPITPTPQIRTKSIVQPLKIEPKLKQIKFDA